MIKTRNNIDAKHILWVWSPYCTILMGNGRHDHLRVRGLVGNGRQICLITLQQVLDIQIGSVVEVVIIDVKDFGFVVELAPGVDALLHVAQISNEFVSLQ